MIEIVDHRGQGFYLCRQYPEIINDELVIDGKAVFNNLSKARSVWITRLDVNSSLAWSRYVQD